jgi:hypothetical protein
VGGVDGAGADFAQALAAARLLEWKVDELRLRLDLAALADPQSRSRLASEVQREASSLGLSPLAAQAAAAARRG